MFAAYPTITKTHMLFYTNRLANRLKYQDTKLVWLPKYMLHMWIILRRKISQTFINIVRKAFVKNLSKKANFYYS